MARAEPAEPGAAGGDYAARHLRWNFTVLLADAASFYLGLALFDGATVLPVLLARLGATDTLVGMVRLLQTLGFTLPALVAAHIIHGRAYHKRYLLWCCAGARIGLPVLPFLLLTSATSRPGVVMAALLVIIGVFWLLDGACAVSWFEIVAKSIPARVRGRFFGGMQTLGGLVGMCSGAIVASVLGSRSLPYPADFAFLAAGWCVGAWMSQVFLTLIREPVSHAVADDERPAFRDFLRSAVPLIRDNPRLARLVLARVALDGAGLAGPFYVLYAQRDLVAPVAAVGLYALARSLGKVCTGPVWGWCSDRFGPANGLRLVAWAVVAVPALALASTPDTRWLLFVAFFLQGAVEDGVWMICSTTLFESVAPHQRPLAVGVATVFQTPSALYGPIGGVISQRLGYRAAFTVALLIGVAGALLAARIRQAPAAALTGADDGASQLA